MKKSIIVLAVALILLVSTWVSYAEQPPDLPRGAPFKQVLTGCLSEDLTLAEVRQFCEDFFLGIIGPPKIVTHCPSDKSQGKQTRVSPFTPNFFCPSICAEGEVEIQCIWEEEFHF